MTLKLNHLFHIPLNIQTIQVLKVMVLNYEFRNIMLWKDIWLSDVINFKAFGFLKRFIFGIKDIILFWVLKWYCIHNFKMEMFILVLKYELFLNDRGVIITMGWQRDRDRIWTYSLSIPKTTLTNRVRGGDSRMK